MLRLLHLCDSLFPIGSFAHSDGLEAAAVNGEVTGAATLGSWMEATLTDTLGRYEGVMVALAGRRYLAGDWAGLDQLDQEGHALRPSSTARQASCAMGKRLLKSWQALHPSPELDRLIAGPGALRRGTLPVGFGVACAAAGIAEREAVAGYFYTRLAATISAAMRLIAIGQGEAHALLTQCLARVPAVVDMVGRRADAGESPSTFAPALDLALMGQQYCRSRLFRS